MTALAALTPPRRDGDDRIPGQRRADALVDMARSVLDSGETPGKVKPHLLIMSDVQALCGHGGGTHETASGVVLTPGQIRQVACDCAISRVVFGPDSQPLDIGRSSRVIPPALARAVIARDRHCQHPGCDRAARWCDIHHKIPLGRWWSDRSMEPDPALRLSPHVCPLASCAHRRREPGFETSETARGATLASRVYAAAPISSTPMRASSGWRWA